MKKFVSRYPIESLLFALVFAAVSTQLKYRAVPATQGNLEQWINISNEMFYGTKDFLFSYGPLYWLTSASPYSVGIMAYDSVTYWIGVGFCACVYAYFWALIAALIYRSRAYVLFIAAFFLHFQGLAESAAFFLWPLATVYYMEYAEDTPARFSLTGLVCLGLLSGAVFYVRFFYGMLAVAVFGSYMFSRLWRRGTVKDLICFVVCTVIAYVVAGLLIFHHAASLTEYLFINSQLNFGNSVDMTLAVENYRRTFIGAAIPILLINIYLLCYRRVLWLTALGLLAIFFKIGFSRTDHYIDYFVTPVTILSLFLLFERRTIGKVVFFLCLGSLTYLAATTTYPGAPTHSAFKPSIDMSAPYADRMEQVYGAFKLPDDVLKTIGRGSIDIYPYNNEYLFANKLDYHHRPLFQNYMTLTPALDSLNQRFLDSDQRPDFMLWTAGILCVSADCNPFDGIDRKYVLNEDPLTSMTILQNYHVVSRFPVRNGAPAMLLQKNDQPSRDSQAEISSERMTFGRWYRVPNNTDGGAIKLAPVLKFTLLGRLKNLLFRGSELTIKCRLSSGAIKDYRLNILNAVSGIWISPFLDRIDLSGEAVTAIMLDAPDTWYFQRDFDARWLRVPMPALETRAPSFAAPVIPSTDELASATSQQCEGSLDTINGSSTFPSRIGPQDGLNIRGWMTVSTKKAGVTPDNVLISLTDTDGKATYFETRRTERGDVATVFKQPSLARSGFETNIDVAKQKGARMLGIAYRYQGKLITCRQFATPLSIEQ